MVKDANHVKIGQKKNIKTLKNGKKSTTKGGGGFDYDKIMCDDIEVISEANRFFKMKCYYSKGMEDKFQGMIQKLLNNKGKFDAFTSYITSHYDSFTPFSKIVVGRIYMRFQEDGITTEDPEQDMEYIFYESMGSQET